ncbi:MAG: DHA2 family efflux MFS transporter permease subunit [bacterium]
MSETIKPSGFKKWLSLFVLALAVAIVVIDGTVLNVSIVNITNDLGTDLKSIQWAFTSYSLVLASLTIFGGRLGDLFGRKKMFVLGAIIFGIGSLVTALAPNIGILILGWSIIEGIGAALMIPASSALLVSNFEGEDRGKAFAIYGATAGAASAFGPILGGYLTTAFSWRWAFGINIFVVAILALGSIIVKGYHQKPHKISLDLLGVFLSSLGMGSITYGIIESSTYGWLQAKKAFEFMGSSYDLAGISITTYGVIFGLLVLVAFVFWELRQENLGNSPLISMKIFLNKGFSIGIINVSLLFAGVSGLFTYGLAIFYQVVLGLSAFDSGIGFIPLSLATFLGAPLSNAIAKKIGQKRIVQVGILFGALGSLIIYFTLSLEATRISLIPGLFVFGLGFGLMIAQVTNLILSSVPVTQAGVASGINGTVREVGRTFGTALIGAAFLATLSSTISDKINSNKALAKTPEPIKQMVVTRVGLGDSSVLKQIPDVVGDQAKNEIIKEAHRSYVDGGKIAIIYTGVFLLVSFLISFTLPEGHELSDKEIVAAEVMD